MPAHPLSDEQRTKIRKTVVQLAVERGFDGWRITDLVKEIGISSRTLYKYFPSKEYLVLDSLVTGAAEDMTGYLDGTKLEGATPVERVELVLKDLTRQLVISPELSLAMVRSLTSGQPAIRPLLVRFNSTMQYVVARALAGGEPTEADRATAELVELAWFSAFILWACDIRSADYIDEIVERAVSALAGNA